jgi:hypothetical protein
MTVPVVLAIAGVVALFLGVWGGGIKAKEIEIPPAPPKARLIVGIVGFIFIGISIWLSSPTSNDGQQASPTNPTSSIPTPTAVIVVGATVSRSQVDEWTLGETTEANVYSCLDKSGKLPAPEISFNKGDTVPKGALIATLFWVDGGAHWDKFPVKPICVYNDWGLFETTDEFQAIGSGGYRRIVP